jgi:ribosomal protein S18 acetylase RimI-like enzyme
MGTAISIREANRDDWPAIERVLRAAWHDDYCTTGEVLLRVEDLEDKVDQLRDEYNAFGSRFIVADDGGRIVGAAVAHEETGRIWIDDLFVLPEARRQGVARELLKHVMANDTEAIAEVNANNAPALALFRELGFVKAVETIVLRRPPEASAQPLR